MATFSTSNPSNYIPFNATASFSYTMLGGGSPAFMKWSLGTTLDSGASASLVSLTNLTSPTGGWGGLAINITNVSDDTAVFSPYALGVTPSVDPNSGALDIDGVMTDFAEQLFTHPDAISFGSLSLPAHTTASIFPIPGFNFGDILVFGQTIQAVGQPDVTMWMVTGVPEPSCLSLLALAGLMLASRRRQMLVSGKS